MSLSRTSSSVTCASYSTTSLQEVSVLPNMRLQLPGAIVLKETVGSCPGGHGTSSTARCAGARVARSLSAIR